MSDFDFSGLTLAELTTLRTNALTALNAILAGGGQSYSMMGRSFTRANLSELARVITAITEAIDLQAGTQTRLGYVNVNL